MCPVTENNANYLTRQRAAFLEGTPGPDFSGGKGESEHVDRPAQDLIGSQGGLRAMGLAKLNAPSDEASIGARNVVERVNAILGF